MELNKNLLADLMARGFFCLFAKLCYNAAYILGVPGGHLVEGGDADVVHIDPGVEYVLEEKDILSKSRNSPFIGKTLKGRNEMTMVGGEIVWERDE